MGDWQLNTGDGNTANLPGFGERLGSNLNLIASGIDQLRAGRLPEYPLTPYAEIARELLLHRFRHAASFNNLVSLDNASQKRLLEWMEALRKRELYLLITGRASQLPDFTQEMHPLFRLFALGQQPRNREEMVRHFADYLDWYIAPRRKMPVGIQLRALGAIGAALMSVLIMGLINLCADPDSGSTIAVPWYGIVLLPLVVWIMSLMGGLRSDVSLPWRQQSLLRHLALYLYIRDCETALNMSARESEDG
jgi:hypothetical protein